MPFVGSGLLKMLFDVEAQSVLDPSDIAGTKGFFEIDTRECLVRGTLVCKLRLCVVGVVEKGECPGVCQHTSRRRPSTPGHVRPSKGTQGIRGGPHTPCASCRQPCPHAATTWSPPPAGARAGGGGGGGAGAQ